jgi:hypothetical protein
LVGVKTTAHLNQQLIAFDGLDGADRARAWVFIGHDSDGRSLSETDGLRSTVHRDDQDVQSLIVAVVHVRKLARFPGEQLGFEVEDVTPKLQCGALSPFLTSAVQSASMIRAQPLQ